jgi:tetratricopeptide (TPR) repeat protein
MQRAVDRYNRRTHADLAIRIGISAGDVTVEDGDYFGDPVVEAARLCMLAHGGEILATDVVRLLGRRSGHQFSNEREVELRGIPAPVAVSELRWEQDEALSPIPLPSRLPHVPRTGVVGRSHERAVLSEALDVVTSATIPRIVLLAGESGIGKSTLMAWMCHAAFEKGAVVLYGRCDDDLVVPHQPFVEALGHLLTHIDDTVLTSLGDERLSALLRLVPDLRRRRPHLIEAHATDPDAERWLLYGAVVALLDEVSEVAPLLLVLDDLHWADRPTLQLLRHLSSHVAGHLLLLGTYRDTALSAAHPLTEALAALTREEHVVRLPLRGFGEDEVIAFVEATAGHTLDDASARLAYALQRETSGNPFFVAEVLRHLVETGAIVRDATGRWLPTRALSEAGLPDSVRQVIGSRVGRLGDDAARVLAAASILGQEFDVDVLSTMLGSGDDSVLEILEAACAAAVVVEDNATPGRFRFAHALVQHTLNEDLSGARRTRLHRAAAEALEARYGAAPGARAAELARHWLSATGPEESGRAVRYSRLAGDHALTALAPTDAIRWYSEALTLLASAPDDAERARCLTGLGEAQRQVGEGAYRETLLEAARLARACGDVDTLVRAALANNRGWASRAGGLDTERIAVLEAALDALPAAHSVERARLLALLALERTFNGDYADRRATSDEALRIARESGDDGTVLDVLMRRPWQTIWMPETVEELHGESSEVVALAERLGDPVGKFWAATVRSSLSVQVGDIAEVVRCEAEKRRLAAQIGQPILAFVIAFSDSWFRLLAGDTEQAEKRAEEALRMGDETGQPDTLAFYGAQLHHIRWHQGRTGEVADFMAHVASQVADVSAFRGAAAHVLVESSREADAAELLEEEKALGFPGHEDFLVPAYYDLWARVATALHDTDAAAVLYERLARWPRLVVFTVVTIHGAVAHNLATLASVLGRYETADEHFAAALKVHEGLKAPFFIALTLFEWAQSIRERGGDRSSDVDTMLRKAHDLAIEHGYAAIEERTNRLLAVQPAS